MLLVTLPIVIIKSVRQGLAPVSKQTIYENGNPLNIDYQEFEWTNGRQLKSITYHFTDGTSKKELEYTYDENGLRTSKNFGIYKFDYIYDGD